MLRFLQDSTQEAVDEAATDRMANYLGLALQFAKHATSQTSKENAKLRAICEKTIAEQSALEKEYVQCNADCEKVPKYKEVLITKADNEQMMKDLGRADADAADLLGR